MEWRTCKADCGNRFRAMKGGSTWYCSTLHNPDRLNYYNRIGSKPKPGPDSISRHTIDEDYVREPNEPLKIG